LDEVYNLRGVTPLGVIIKNSLALDEVYNLRGVTTLYELSGFSFGVG